MINKEKDEVNDIDMEKLELQADIYCYTYYKFIVDYNPSVQKDLKIKCMCTFFF